MKITAIAPWFGSKRTLAPEIVRQLGPHSAYWEPFCGSMAVLLAKPECGHETVNDLHGDLINLARVIQDPIAGAALYRRLRRVWMDEEKREESLIALPKNEDPLERAYHYFIVSWFGRNGFSGTTSANNSSFAVRYTPGGGHGGQRFASAVESIPAWRRRMRRVTILRRDAFEIIEKIDDAPGVCIYVDPPYVDKSAKYEHDFSTADHERLAKSLARFKTAKVVVSYYVNDLVLVLYPRKSWKWVDCAMSKGLHNSGLRGKTSSEAPEVLLINGPVIRVDDPALFA